MSAMAIVVFVEVSDVAASLAADSVISTLADSGEPKMNGSFQFLLLANRSNDDFIFHLV
jgi:hypothetical protein